MTTVVALPPAAPSALGDLLRRRRSQRIFSEAPLTLPEVAALLFAAQGRVDDRRTAPSAGARYPLELTLAALRVEGLEPALHRYDGDGLTPVGDVRAAEIAAASFEAPWLADAPAVVLVGADFSRTTLPYADQPPPGRAARYVWMEGGIAAQNLSLRAAELGLACVLVGGFDDAAAARVFRLPPGEQPIAVLPIGRSG